MPTPAGDARTTLPRLHVVVIDHMLGIGGGELAIARLAGELEPDIHMTFVLPGEGAFAELLRAAGRSVRIIPLGPAQGTAREEINPLTDIVRHGPRLTGAVVQTARLIRQLRGDVVYTNTLKAHIYGNLAARLANRPCVMHVRDILSPPYISGRLRRALQAYLTAVPPAALIANSLATGAKAPIGREAHVIPSGVAVMPEQKPLPPGGPVLALMGRITPWKGQDVAIRAIPRLIRQFPEVQLRIAGDASVGSAEYETKLRDLAQRLGVSDRVEFCGFVENVYSFFADAHVVLHTSISPEPFGQVIVEALAVGRPVVATVGGGPSEILAGERGGLLTPPGDDVALADAVGRVLSDSSLRSRLSESAVERASDYTLRQSARLTRELLYAVSRLPG